MDRKFFPIGAISLVILAILISGCVDKPEQKADDSGAT